MAEVEFKRIAIEPVTRVEGHGKVSILLDQDNRVQQARLHIVEFRGFERFIQGRPFWELPVLVQRLCGICPVSHHLCAAKAVDGIVGAEKLTPTGEKMRRLMHYGQMYQSHALHFFHLASPDLLFGFDAPVGKRNVFGVLAEHPDLAVQAVKMRKFGQEIIKVTAGKKVHGTGAIPGGINKNLSIEERDPLLEQIDQIIAWSHGALKIARDYTLENLEQIADFGSFDSNHLSIVRSDGAMDLYDGNLRAVDAEGNKIIDGVPPTDYLNEIAEEVRPWSYMKFPFLKKVGSENGWFRVGPLSRINTCDFIDTPDAEAARKEFAEFSKNKPCNVTMAYHWTRMIELLHSAEKIRDLLNDGDLQGNDLVTPPGERRGEYVAIIEAPRGTLTHHYQVNEDDQVTMANLIVSTTCNNEGMNRTVRKIADDVISGVPEITEGLLNNIEVGIRAYDPCLSCATHALGQMPLEVTLIDVEGKQIDPAGAVVSDAGGTLLLAWGNPGRLDDGLGPAFADAAAGWGFESLTIDSDYQLQIEDAHEVARHRRILFVDADRTGPEPFRVEKIKAGKSGIAFSSHSVSPESVLALARDLFGAEPEAWLVGIRGYEFDEFGERLSGRACVNLDAATDFIQHAFRSDDYQEFRPQAAEVSHG